MNKIVYLVVALFIVQSITISAQDVNPKREFRAAWVATVINLDWPTSPFITTENQKQQLIDILDGLKETGINAIIFQIRTECDALYNSPYEPWSYWLTGNQGSAPNPYYDPLEFAVEEAHKRGLEIHAWFNPYRAVREVGNYSISSQHVTVENPDWVLTFGNLKILNPGLQAVRDYNVQIIMDVVNRYDIDGVHFDDYFYPYSGISNQDNSTFQTEPRGFTNIGDWRRDNVNIFVKAVHDSINAVKPWVKFGISPFGIWKNGVPSGITGLDAYSTLYADAIAWLQQQSVDYLTPQLYWPHGGGQDYGKLMPWWADSVAAHDRHFYPGQAAYRIPNWSSESEMPRQIRANRNNPKTLGSVFFRALVGVLDNPKGFADSLKNDLYKNPALLPVMDWKDQVSPNTPSNLRYAKLSGVRGDGLIWNTPTEAADGDTAFMYAVYKFDSPSVQESDLEISTNLNNVVGTTYSALKTNEDVTAQSYFAITTLDRNYNESSMSEVIPVQVQTPEKPLTYSPVDLAVNQKDTIEFIWEDTPHSNFNRLQIATDENFTNLLVDQNSIVDTIKSITGFTGLSTYFWRITASNLAGESDFSEVRSFTTGFPLPPSLLLPEDKLTEVTLTPEIVWNTTQTAVQYRLQVAEGLSIEPEILVVDTVISDTTFTTHELKENKIYTWSVGALNEYGFSRLAAVFKFRTTGTTNVVETDESVPDKYSLNQNYPNPFNPTTIISFAVPERGNTVLRVYNILGQQVKELLNRDLQPGRYSVEFNAENLPSGMYIYVMQSGSQLLSKKMMLIK